MLKMKLTGERNVWGAAKSLLLAAIFMVTFACLAPQTAQAQYKASLRGTVQDPTGAVVPGATVTLVNLGTNETAVVTSDGNGIYTFNGLPPDHFSLSVAHAGFKKKEIALVVLIPEQANALNVTLELGNASQTITVSGSAAQLLDTDTATVSATITSNEIQHLPSFNRDVFQLAQLAPGVFGDGQQGSGGGPVELPGNQGPGASGTGPFSTENGVQIQTRGQQYETNGISIDGMSTTSSVWGGASVITPTEDSVASVKITSNSYDAENGRFTGANIEVTSKGGTNEIHGSLFFKASRPGLNAYQRWNGVGSDIPGTAAERGVNKDESRFNQYGGSVGGPLWKGKLYAFFAIETAPTVANGTSQGWYETSQFNSLVPTGSIASVYANYPGEAVAPGSTQINETCAQAGLTLPGTCQQVSGGLDIGSPLKTPLGTMDQGYVNNGQPGVGGGLDGVPDIAFYNVASPSTTSQTQYNGRLDADITHNDRLTFAIYWFPYENTSFNGPARAANLWHTDRINQATSLVWNHIFSPTLLNQARANAAGWRYNEVTSNPQAPFGLPTDSINQTGSITISDFGPPSPADYDQWTFGYNDVLTKTLGRSNIKAGADVTRLYYKNECVGCALPSYSFWNIWDFANDAPHEQYAQFDPLTGVPTSARQDNRLNIFSGFVQDDYKLRPNLTVNAGLRYEYFGSMYAKQNNISDAYFGPAGDSILTSAYLRIGGHQYSPQKTNFGPQLGFAWQPMESHNKLVLRGGFGINYNQNEIAILANGNGNPPAVVSGYLSSPNNTAPTGLLYETNANLHSLDNYPSNPYFITPFGTNNLPTGATAVQVVGYPSHPKTGVSYHYSLDAQYELPFDSVATIGYMGNEGRHSLVNILNWNNIAATYGIPLNPNISQYQFWNNQGTGNYNALVTSLKHRLANNFNVEAQYTWAKSMDELSGPYEADPYPFDPKASYGRADYNVQSAFKLFGLWQPVFFHGAHGWVEKVAGDWSLSGIFNAHTGFPWTPFYNTNCCIYTSNAGISQLRPAQYLGGAGQGANNQNFQGSTNPNYSYSQAYATQFFSASPYQVAPTFPATGAAPLPGIRRNSLNGPDYQSVDASLTKGFGLPKMPVLGEHAVLEFRADAYNLFNKTNVNVQNINNVVGNENPDGSIASIQSNFGTATNGLNGRTVQLQARFSF